MTSKVQEVRMEPDVARRFLTLEQRLANVESLQINESAELTTLNDYLHAFRREWKLETDAKHEETHARLATIEFKLNRIEATVRNFSTRIDIFDTRIDSLESKIDGIGGQVGQVSGKMEEMRGSIDEILALLKPKTEKP